jgi:hypothetical protein
MSVEPIVEYLRSLPRHDLWVILETLELADRALVFDNCQEKELFRGLLLSIWKSLKLHEVTDNGQEP